MTKALLGQLEMVDPKTVWPHEAHDFTPWLLANYQVLGDLLEMDIELKVAEHPVGDFWIFSATICPTTASLSSRTS